MTISVPDEGHRAAAQCIELSGEDARAFAQAQFSGDVGTLQAGHWQWNAWLDAQGRVRALMHLADIGDGRLLALLRGGDAQGICDALRPYVLRSRVQLQAFPVRPFRVGDALSINEVHSDGDAIDFGYGDRSLRLISRDGDGDHALKNAERERAFRLADIRAGWPFLPNDGDQAFLPPALGLEHLGAVSFSKGCYPGQEIAARLHYRGGHKMRLCRIRADRPLSPGQKPFGPGPSARGVVLGAIETPDGFEGLAVLEDASSLNNNELDNEFIVIERFGA